MDNIFGMGDYVGQPMTPKKIFTPIGLPKFSPAIPNIYMLCPFFIYFFYFFLLGFLRTCTGRTVRPILTNDGSKDVFWSKEVPFGG